MCFIIITLNLLLAIIKVKEDEYEQKIKTNSIYDEKDFKSIKNKIKILTTMMRMQRTLREESEVIIKLKGYCPGNKIPKGLIMQGPQALRSALENFKNAKILDKENEQIPNENK